jgi:hypothetical protein
VSGSSLTSHPLNKSKEDDAQLCGISGRSVSRGPTGETVASTHLPFGVSGLMRQTNLLFGGCLRAATTPSHDRISKTSFVGHADYPIRACERCIQAESLSTRNPAARTCLPQCLCEAKGMAAGSVSFGVVLLAPGHDRATIGRES